MSKISRYITSRYLTSANATHLKRYPQLVGYTFDAITCSIHLDGRFEKDELRLLEKMVFPKLHLLIVFQTHLTKEENWDG